MSHNQQAAVASDARIDTRYPASAIPSIKAVRLSPGDAVELVNISRSGVLVEGRTRFVPGTRVTVLLDGGFTPASIKAKIIRCQVASISGGTLRYQSGIQFEKRLDELDAHVPEPPAAVPLPTSTLSAAPTPVPAAPQARRVFNRW